MVRGKKEPEHDRASGGARSWIYFSPAVDGCGRLSELCPTLPLVRLILMAKFTPNSRQIHGIFSCKTLLTATEADSIFPKMTGIRRH